jgi:hypothetical protein
MRTSETPTVALSVSAVAGILSNVVDLSLLNDIQSGIDWPGAFFTILRSP